MGFHTPFGSYRFLRLPFGIVCAPEIFQKLLTKYFGDIPNVVIYFDDILIAGSTEEEHDIAFKEVMKRAESLNIKFNKNKFQFKKPTINYMGHVISGEGISPNPDYLEAILQLKNPRNRKDELQSFLGTINYVREHIPKLADLVAPLRGLLKKNSMFTWQQIHSDSFNKIKEAVCAISNLTSFDPKKPILIQCDASQFGLGACLLQNQKPVAFASRNLSDAETRYAQIEKELLSIVFAVKRFHNMVYGFKILIENDHKPLEPSYKKNISQIMSNRLQRLLLKLLPYDLEVKYIPGKDNLLADLLSRNFIVSNKPEDEIQLNDVVHCVDVKFQLSNAKFLELQNATLNDPLINQVKQLLMTDWTKCNVEMLQPFFKIRCDLTINDEILYFKNRIVIPTILRPSYLKLLHGNAHLGTGKTIEKAKLICYWPGYVSDIENYVKACIVCNKFSPKNVKEPLIPHTVPTIPFHKLGADIAEFQKKNYLIVTDYHSKWLEIKHLRNKTASEVVTVLKEIFRTHGIPAQIVADNQPFGSFEVKQFADQFNFTIVNSSPRYPQSNGMAESAVKRAKSLLRKVLESKSDLDLAILEYNNAPIVELGASPAQMLMGRVLRTQIPISEKVLKPETVNVEVKRQNHLDKVKHNYDQTAKSKEDYHSGENIWLLDTDNRWYPAVIVEKLSNVPRSYIVKNCNGVILRRNSKFIRKRCSHIPQTQTDHLWIFDELNSNSESQIESECDKIQSDEPPAFSQTNIVKLPVVSKNTESQSQESEPLSEEDSDITVIENQEIILNESSSESEDFLGFETQPSSSTPVQQTESVTHQVGIRNLDKSSSNFNQIFASPIKPATRNFGRGCPKKLDPNFVSK